MRPEEIKKLKKAKFYPIPILSLGGRYYIDSNCNILDTENDESDALIYTWDPVTAMTPITLTTTKDEQRMVSPAKLYVITHYGYLDAEINDSGYGHPSIRYEYIITVKERLADNTIVLNNDIFKYSAMHETYANQTGCVCRGFKPLRHHFDKKGYWAIDGNTCSVSYQRIHRIVYDAWVGIEDINNHIHHMDEQVWNNYYKNLQELTPDEHKRLKNSNYLYSDEIVYEVCKLMSDGMRPTDAARLVGIPPQSAVRFRDGHRIEISGQFSYPDLPGFKFSPLTENDVHEICKLFCENTLSNKEISLKYDVSITTIKSIRKRKYWKDVSANYDFPQLGPGEKPVVQSAHRQNPNASITEKEAIEVYKLLQQGYRICEIRNMLNIPYGIIKSIKYKYSWSAVTDKLDSGEIN